MHLEANRSKSPKLLRDIDFARLTIVIVEKDSTIKQLLSTSGHQDLCSKLIFPCAQEGQFVCPLGTAIGRQVLDLAAEVCYRRVSGGITRSMAMEEMDMGKIRTRR